MSRGAVPTLTVGTNQNDNLLPLSFAPPLSWTDWHPLPLVEPPSPRVLAEILDGGQAFRWRPIADDDLRQHQTRQAVRPSAPVWQGVWGDIVARLRSGAAGRLDWSAPAALAGRAPAALLNYFGASVDFDKLTDHLPWRSDAHLARCIDDFPGLRILRQPFGETLLCFLCSATKQIAQIRQMTGLLAQRFGSEIAPGIHRLPTWREIAVLDEAALQTCRLGFRARHIFETARYLADRPHWLEQTGRLSYPDARSRLRELPGVGEKIADCVLLFGAGRLEAFPVDTWISRAMQRRYGLASWNARQIAHFGRAHFGPCAGLAQQYLFAWERAHGRSSEQSLGRNPGTEST